MSSRNLRKIRPVEPLEIDSSDEEDSPPPQINKYAGLHFSDDSDTVPTPESEGDNEPVASTSQGGARRKTTQKKKLKNKQRSKNESAHGNNSYRSNGSEELDEIDLSVLEVNAILGKPPTPPPEPEVIEKTENPMTVEAKCLDATYEQIRRFGPEPAETIRERLKYQPHRVRILRKILIKPVNDTRLYDFVRSGLSMSILKQEEGIKHFVYNHDEELQKRHLRFLIYYASNYLLSNEDTIFNFFATYRKNMHVEPLLEIADRCFRIEEVTMGSEIIENVVAYLQHIAHPCLDLTSTNVRLPYEYRENRPFHVAMLKYAYLLSNKACHRTALEITKMLLNIDPTDPLAVVFVIDSLALRAREHEWLIRAIEHFNKERQANMLFNMQYSYAMALFHVALKKKKDMSEADKFMQYAILAFPKVFTLILDYCYIKDPVLSHELFAENASRNGRNQNLELNELMKVYAKFSHPRWRETAVMEWLLKNARVITEKYDNDEAIKSRASELRKVRELTFMTWPNEIARHMQILSPMAMLILEQPITTLRHQTCSWDPLFNHDGINRYGYNAPLVQSSPNIPHGGRTLFYRFFTSMIPSTEREPPVND